LQVFVNNNITGNIDFWHVVRVDAGNPSLPFPQFYGAIYGNVTHNPVGADPPPALGTVRAYQFGTGLPPNPAITARRGDILLVEARRDCFADVVCDLGSITRVQTGTDSGPEEFYGDLTGNVLAPKGSIQNVIGAFLGPITYGTTPIRIEAQNGIDLIQAYYDIWADIAANANNGLGDLTRLETTYAGTLYGSVAARDVDNPIPSAPAIILNGDLAGNVTLAGSVLSPVIIGGRFLSGRTFSVGDTLYDGGVSIGNGLGLNGQMIINANGNTAGFNYWIGGVCLGSMPGVCLTPQPRYIHWPADVGGGSVGEAPFSIYRNGGQPRHDQVVSLSTIQKAVLRYYGPVFAIGTPAIKVEARRYDVYPPGPWLDITSDFDISTSFGGDLRDIGFVPNAGAFIGFAEWYEYRITPETADTNPARLRCLQVKGQPTVRSGAEEYLLFRVQPG
jgi:hypothetical protein